METAEGEKLLLNLLLCVRDDAGRRLRQGAGSLDRPRPPGEGHVRLRHQVPPHANANGRVSPPCVSGVKPHPWICGADVLPCCPRRFHSSLTDNQRWIRERSHESYAKNYSVVFPFDEPLASRNMRRDPFHQVNLRGVSSPLRTSKQTPACLSVGAVSPGLFLDRLSPQTLVRC